MIFSYPFLYWFVGFFVGVHIISYLPKFYGFAVPRWLAPLTLVAVVVLVLFSGRGLYLSFAMSGTTIKSHPARVLETSLPILDHQELRQLDQNLEDYRKKKARELDLKIVADSQIEMPTTWRTQPSSKSNVCMMTCTVHHGSSYTAELVDDDFCRAGHVPKGTKNVYGWMKDDLFPDEEHSNPYWGPGHEMNSKNKESFDQYSLFWKNQ